MKNYDFIKNSSVLTDEQENVLFKEGKKDLIAKHNYKLVMSIANEEIKKLQNSGVFTTPDLDDIIQDGMVGLLQAIEKFDYTKGFKFSTYATCWIEKEIHNGIRNNKIIKLSSNKIDEIDLIRKSLRDLESLLERAPTPNEVLLSLDKIFSSQKVKEALSISPVVSLDAPVDKEKTISIKDTIASPEQKKNNYQKELLEQALNILNKREKHVLVRYFYEGHTLEEIGNELGVSKERIRQIKHMGIRHMREYYKKIGIKGGDE